MRKSSSLGSLFAIGTGQFKLRVALLLLVFLNAIAVYLYFDPPGGSQSELAYQNQQLKTRIAAMKAQDSRVRTMAQRVEHGSDQIAQFEKAYFLPKRVAYSAVIAEIQRMAKLSGLTARDAGFAEEPIEGTADLSLLNIKANFQGSYANVMKFLYETDRSPMLLMLDSLTAAPEQKNGEINTDIRFQVVIEDQALDQVSRP